MQESGSLLTQLPTHLSSPQAALRLGNGLTVLRRLTVQLPLERLRGTGCISQFTGRLLQRTLQLRPSYRQLLDPPLQRCHCAGLLCCMLRRGPLSVSQLGSQCRFHRLCCGSSGLQLGLQLLAPNLPLLLTLRHVTLRRSCCRVGGSGGGGCGQAKGGAGPCTCTSCWRLSCHAPHFCLHHVHSGPQGWQLRA